MVEKVTETWGWQQYVNLRGRWDERVFDELTEMLAERKKNPIPIRNVFLLHAMSIGERSGIEFTPEEIYLFGVISERPVEKDLYDIRLMAEVILLMGNVAKRQLLEDKYSNVNFYPEIQLSNSEQRGVRQITYGQN